MISIIVTAFERWRKVQNFKNAVKLANRATAKTGKKHMVFLMEGTFKVADHQTLKSLWHEGQFKKGVSYDDIKKTALYTTMQ